MFNHAIGMQLLLNKSRQIIFYVKDSGIGIDPVCQQEIFERFRKIEDDKREQLSEGTGIGLSISKHLVELMGGRIWVDSEYLEGSTFWFALPYEQ